MKSVSKILTYFLSATSSLFTITTEAQNAYPTTGDVSVALANTGLRFYGGGEKIIGTSDWGIQFQTSNGTPRMTITNTGDIKLHTQNNGLVFFGGGEKIIGTSDFGIQFQTGSGTPRMTIANNGSIMIGNTSTPAGYKLYVQTGILTEKVRVAVIGSSNWADYIFHKNYKLPALSEVERFVKQYKHLPGIPSAEEVVRDGIDLGQMNAKLLG